MYNESLTCASSVPPYQEKCPGQSSVPLCPAGKYCPSATEIYDCPKGYHCPEGTFNPIECFRDDLTCPHSGLAYPYVFIPIGILMLTAFTILMIVYVLSTRSVIQQRNKRRIRQALEVKNRKNNRIEQFMKHHYGTAEDDEEEEEEDDDGGEEYGDDGDDNHNGDDKDKNKKSNPHQGGGVRFASSVGSNDNNVSFATTTTTTTTTTSDGDGGEASIWKKTFNNIRKASCDEENKEVSFSTVNNMFRTSSSASSNYGIPSESSVFSSESSSSSSSSSSRKIGKKMTVWLFLGADLDTHKALLVLSVIGVVVGGVLGLAYPTEAPVFDHWVNIGIYILTLSGIICIGSGLGCFFLSVYKSAWTVVQDDSRKRARTVAALNESGGGSGRASVSPKLSLFGVGGRAVSMDNRKKDAAFLGSLKEKIDTRVNLEVDRLGLKLNTDKRVVLAGVDGKFEAGSVTAIMGPSGAGKVCL
jgi:ABC-type multidrug transport system fused ATPase/permease subunit